LASKIVDNLKNKISNQNSTKIFILISVALFKMVMLISVLLFKTNQDVRREIENHLYEENMNLL